MSELMTIHICSPAPIAEWKQWFNCPICKEKTIAVHHFVPWYGQYTVCTKCGDSWSGDDGYRDPRPFYRNWKRDAIEAAQKRADAIVEPVDECEGIPDRVMAAIHADIEANRSEYPQEANDE